jgi:putative transcriptional regulator
MKRDELIEKVRKILSRTGFLISDRMRLRSVSFDIAARRDDKVILIKVLLNVDSFGSEGSKELRLLATRLNASPMLIGLCSNIGKLEDGVVYSRAGVPIVSLKTFSDFMLEGIPPYVFSAPGGLYVKIDGEALERARAKKDVSLGTLAEIAGVSRRAVQMYQDGMGTTIEVALRMEEFLGEPIIVAVNPFLYSKTVEKTLVSFNEFETLERVIFKKLHELGFGVLPTIKCPFEALTKDQETIWITGVSKANKGLVKKAAMVSNFSNIVGKDGVIFAENVMRFNIEGTPIIRKKELKKMEDADDIIELIDERKK